MSEWISVKDQLPEEYKRVLVFRGNYEGDDKDEMIHAGFLHPKDGFYGSQYGLLDDDLYPHTLVTHWMPLPEINICVCCEKEKTVNPYCCKEA